MGATAVAAFVAQKKQCWVRDALGHWAIVFDDRYVGWGSFQSEGDQ